MKTVLGWLTALALGASIPVSIAHNLAPARPAAGAHLARPASDGVPGNLVYVCTAWPCTFNQVFATYDPVGDPLFAVSPLGDIGSFGLAYSVFPLGPDAVNIGPRMSVGWETPPTYQKIFGSNTGCNAPHWVITPNDSGSQLQIWHCGTDHLWHIYKTL